MIDYKNLTNDKPNINYDDSELINAGYKLHFALDFENPDLQEVMKHCEKNNWPYKIIDGDGRQKHVWIKGWIRE